MRILEYNNNKQSATYPSLFSREIKKLTGHSPTFRYNNGKHTKLQYMLWDLDVTKDDDSDTLDNNKLDKMEDIFNQVVDKYCDGIIYHYFPRGGNQIRSSYEVILKNQSPDDIIDIDKLSFYQQLGANNDEIAKEFPKNAVKYFIGSDYVYRFVVNPEERKQLKDFCKKYGYKINL